jgi:hypothetical protein
MRLSGDSLLVIRCIHHFRRRMNQESNHGRAVHHSFQQSTSDPSPNRQLGGPLPPCRLRLQQGAQNRDSASRTSRIPDLSHVRRSRVSRRWSEARSHKSGQTIGTSSSPSGCATQNWYENHADIIRVVGVLLSLPHVLMQPRIRFGCDALTQGAPTRTRSPVGAGMPPAGSIVTATATGEGMSGGVRNTPSARPDTSGSISPALIGPPGRTTHT